jgi:hypothetical protein
VWWTLKSLYYPLLCGDLIVKTKLDLGDRSEWIRVERDPTLCELHDRDVGILCGCSCFIYSSASIQNCQCSTSPGVFFGYRTYIFLREEVPLSCLRLTQAITQASTTRLYRSYIKKT